MHEYDNNTESCLLLITQVRTPAKIMIAVSGQNGSTTAANNQFHGQLQYGDYYEGQYKI
jgi:hypothetical protein